MISTPPCTHLFPYSLHHLTKRGRPQCLPKVSAVKVIWFVFLTKTYFSHFISCLFSIAIEFTRQSSFREFWGNKLILAPFLTNQKTEVGDHWALSGQTEVMSCTVQFNTGCAVQDAEGTNSVRGRRSPSWESGDGWVGREAKLAVSVMETLKAEV